MRISKVVRVADNTNPIGDRDREHRDLNKVDLHVAKDLMLHAFKKKNLLKKKFRIRYALPSLN